MYLVKIWGFFFLCFSVHYSAQMWHMDKLIPVESAVAQIMNLECLYNWIVREISFHGKSIHEYCELKAKHEILLKEAKKKAEREGVIDINGVCDIQSDNDLIDEIEGKIEGDEKENNQRENNQRENNQREGNKQEVNVMESDANKEVMEITLEGISQCSLIAKEHRKKRTYNRYKITKKVLQILLGGDTMSEYEIIHMDKFCVYRYIIYYLSLH